MARTRSAALAGTVSISNFAEFIATPPPGTPRGRPDRGRGCCFNSFSSSCALIATVSSSSLPPAARRSCPIGWSEINQPAMVRAMLLGS